MGEVQAKSICLCGSTQSPVDSGNDHSGAAHTHGAVAGAVHAAERHPAQSKKQVPEPIGRASLWHGPHGRRYFLARGLRRPHHHLGGVRGSEYRHQSGLCRWLARGLPGRPCGQHSHAPDRCLDGLSLAGARHRPECGLGTGIAADDVGSRLFLVALLCPAGPRPGLERQERGIHPGRPGRLAPVIFASSCAILSAMVSIRSS